jgi:RNA polymerase sigma-70 factor (ECF subfamily)
MSLLWPSADDRLADALADARRGDAAAFRRVHAAVAPRVHGFVRRRLSAADADDVAGRVWLRVVERLDDYDPRRGPVVGWVLAIARSAVVDHERSRRRGGVVAGAVPDGEDTVATLASPLDRLLDGERDRALAAQLRDLPPATAELLALRFADGLRHAEIAAVLGASEAAVKQRLSRALKDLRERIARAHTTPGDVDYVARS